MSAFAIRAEDLAKRYRLGARERYRRFSELPARCAAAVAGWFDNLLRRGNTEAGWFWALEGVSFEVAPGEVLGIIGRNGAGKSTLLKILSRITHPTRGQARLRGRVGSLLEVGTGFHPELTGRENIFLNGTILGMRHAEVRRKFDEIVDFAEIETFLDTPVKHYSSGMAVRLAFAVAAHLEPEILLVDEVLAVGDAAFQRKCLGKMSDVAGSGRTVLLVSHNMDAIQRLCRRAIALEQGRVLALGDPADVVRTYLEAFRAEGRIKPRFFPGAIVSELDCQINGQPAGRPLVLNPDEPLVLSITCTTREPSTCPRIDVAFYRYDALKLFALASDMVVDHALGPKSRQWTCRVDLGCLPLAPSNYYIDLGIRQEHQGEYVVLWNRVSEFTTTGGVTPVYPGSILTPTARVTIESREPPHDG